MTINVKLRSALALAVLALAVTSLELRSANAEYATPVRAGKAPSLVDNVRKTGVNIVDQRKGRLLAEKKSGIIAEGTAQIIAEKKGRIIAEATTQIVDNRKGRIIAEGTSQFG
ncbi:MAG TPA: hypothetical protein VK148_18445, partial [Xanthobacteraceae bacterium]|nr:hypothetical protein [Xanthobacteraceae bacterium]